MQEWIMIREAAVLFDCPERKIARFVRNGLLEKVPCHCTPRPPEHVNQRFFLRADQVREVLAERRPTMLSGDWLCYEDAALHIGMADNFIKKAVAAGDLRTASWIEIPADQRVSRRQVYVNRSELDQLVAGRYCNQALLLPQHHDPFDLAYAAGFFDGEGCVTLHQDRRGRGCSYNLRASAANTNPTIIRWFKDTFGGGAHARKDLNEAHKIPHHWCINSAEAYRFLALIRPYLRVKQEQADLAIHFYERLNAYSGRGGKPVSEAELEWRLQQVRLLHELNRKGRVSSE